jgi:uncharacterized protein (DUF1778 family)
MTTDSNRKKRETNLNIRATLKQKQIISQAAKLKHTTVSNFVLEKAFEAAQATVLEQRHFVLSAEQWDKFCEALDGPAREFPGLQKLLTEPGVFDQK